MQEALEIMPGDEGVLETIAEIEALRSETVSKIALAKAEDATSPPSNARQASVQYDTPTNMRLSPGASDEPHVFKVNEVVSAKYAGDRQYYPATIVSVMGSKTAPIYTVTFKGYSGTETVRANEIRPIAKPQSAASQKRKADGPVTAHSSGPVTLNNGSVLSAPSTVNPAVTESLKRESQAPLDATSTKPKKKARSDKSLDKAKASWQNWQAKTSSGKIAKVANKESMFRTGEKPGSKGELRVF